MPESRAASPPTVGLAGDLLSPLAGFAPWRYPARVPSRRTLLTAALAAAAGLALPRPARAIGPGSKFRFGQLQLGSGTSWNPRPTALRRLGWEIEKRTSIEVELESHGRRPDERGPPPGSVPLPRGRPRAPAPRPRRRSRRCAASSRSAASSLIDSAEGTTDGAFDVSVRKLIGAIFPPPGQGPRGRPRRSRRLQVVLPARSAPRPPRARARHRGRDPRRAHRRRVRRRTTSAGRGRATTSATTS